MMAASFGVKSMGLNACCGIERHGLLGSLSKMLRAALALQLELVREMASPKQFVQVHRLPNVKKEEKELTEA